VREAVSHGQVRCDRCWSGVRASTQDAGPFRLLRDPGHWGSSNPSVLVLGISKGNTQSRAFANGEFDTVVFKGIRPRLLEALQAVGLLTGEVPAQFERRFLASETQYAFANVVRCSLTGMNRKKGIHSADSPNVIPAFSPGSPGYTFVSACVDQHIGRLPPATRTVILLGNTSAYVKNLRSLVELTLGRSVMVNDMAYRVGDVLLVHVCHPSKGNGHFGAFIRGEGTSGMKMRLARSALHPPQA
jgi:hypothetical protein